MLPFTGSPFLIRDLPALAIARGGAATGDAGPLISIPASGVAGTLRTPITTTTAFRKELEEK